MAGIIVSIPPTVEVPPGNNANNPSSLPPVTYQYAVLNIPQTWGAKQTFPAGNISVQAADVVGYVDATNASNITSGTLPAARIAATGRPYVILTSGQSNFELAPTFAWSPNANAKIWNGGREGVAGSAFVALASSTVILPAKIASDIADNNLTRAVYLINVVQGGTAISHWLSGTGAPDVYATITTEVAAALASIGVSKIDYFAWWQGESDGSAGSTTYQADFASLIARLRGNSWFPAETPMLIFGLEDEAQSGLTGQNVITQALATSARIDPDRRKFIYTATLQGSTYWDVTIPGHMTGQGYFSAGAMGANAILHGGRPPVSGATYDPVANQWRTDDNLFVGVVSPPSGTVRAEVIYGAGAGTGAGTFVAGNNGGSTAWSLGNVSAILGGAYDATFMLNSSNGTYRFGIPSPVSGSVGATVIFGAGSGTGGGSFASGNNGGSTAWAIGNASSIFGGAYDATTVLSSANGAYRLNWTNAGLVTSSANGTLSATALGTGVATALGVNIGSAGAPVLFNGALGTPTSGTLSNVTGLPVSTGIGGLAAGVATFLATPSSANLSSALTTKTGTGNAVFGTSPQVTTPDIVGTTAAGNANAGSVGEYVSSVIASGSAVSLATVTGVNMTSISLTAGDWDVWYIPNFIPGATTNITQLFASISTTSATSSSAGDSCSFTSYGSGGVVPGVNCGAPMIQKRINVNATTTVYAVAQCTFTVSTLGAWGSLQARRVR